MTFGDPEGTWWVRSQVDPRWNKIGRGMGRATDRTTPGELGTWLKECRRKFGKPPQDIECGFIKGENS